MVCYQPHTYICNMTKAIKLLTLLLLIIGVNDTRAQEAWTLEKCIEHALGNNISVGQAQLASEQSKLLYQQSKGAVLPNLNASAGHNYNFGRTIDPFTNQFVNQSIQSNNISLSTGMVLFNGLQNHNNIAQAKTNLMASLSELEAAKNNIMLNVSTLYLQAIQNKKQAEGATLQKENTKAQLERSKKLVEAGVINALSIYNLEAQLATDELNLINFENAWRQSIVALKTLLMIAPETPFEPVIPESVQPELEESLPLQVLVQDAIRRLPETQAAELRLEAAHIGEKAAKGARSPRLSVFANINTVYSESRREISDTRLMGFREIGIVQGSGTPVLVPDYAFSYRITPFGEQIRDNFGQALGFGLSIPILNGFQTHLNISRSRIQIQQQELLLSQTKNQIYTDVANAWANTEAARQRYEASLKNEEAQGRNYEFSSKRFEAGLLNSAELIQAQNNLNNARITRIQAQFEYIFRKNVLRFYQGKDMKLN